MKSSSLVLGIMLLAGVNAFAGEYQTKECGLNVAQVQKIIDDHADWELSSTHASRFIGKWGEDGSIKIDSNGSFSYQSYRFKACPQSDGKMVIINLDDPSYVGVMRLHSRNMMVVAGFTGMASVANGPYPRQGSAVATSKGGREF